MATSYRTFDTDRIQMRTIFARTDKNAPIPSSHILIADGNGATHWSSISTILEISSFRTIVGNSGPSFSADMSYNVLKVSTTGIRGLFESYVDPTTSTLMLSNVLPPIGVTNGSVPAVTDAAASNLAGLGEYMYPVSGNSTIKFLGVRDIVLSTNTAFKATFITISTFTSQGYLAISGETFSLRPAVASTFSTNRGVASFISSLPFQLPWNRPAATTAMFNSGRDLYFSSLGFSIDTANNNWFRFLDRSAASTTKCFVEFSPSFLFDRFQLGTGSMVKEISSFLAINGMATIFPESVVSHQILSQESNVGVFNSFQNTIKLEVNPYTSLFGNFTSNANFLDVQIYHRVVNGIYDGTNTGFNSTTGGLLYQDNTCRQNTGYLQMFSAGSVMP